MGCLKLNIENPTLLRVLNGGKSELTKKCVDTSRFGYNSMEMDNEFKGNGNSYTTEFRQYDPRLGRWLSLDPLMGKFPWQSPYCAFDNNPIFYTDPLGLESDPPKGLPENPEHEQVAKAENGKEYQFVVGDNGKGEWGNYSGEAVKITPGNKGGSVAQESKPEENHSMMNTFFGVNSDGSSASDKISVYDQSNYDYCNSNPTILQNRLEANNRENGLLTYAGVSLAAPFAIFGLIETAPVWAPALYNSATFVGRTAWSGAKFIIILLE